VNWWHDGILVGEKRSLWTKNEDGECSVSRAIVCVTSESVVVAKKTLDRRSLPSLQSIGGRFASR